MSTREYDAMQMHNEHCNTTLAPLATTLAAQGPTTRTGATLCCLTPDAGGELTGNPQPDWLL